MVADTLILQQAGRPNAVKRIGFASGTDSLGIVYGMIITSGAATISPGLQLRFYNTTTDLFDATDADLNTFDGYTNIPFSSAIAGYAPVFAPSPGWQTIIAENKDVADDVFLSYIFFVYP